MNFLYRIFSFRFWQQPSQRCWRQGVVLSLIAAFMAPSLTWAFQPRVYDISTGQVIFQQKPVRIPAQWGQVTQGYQGGQKLVIYVQDLHCNFEVQTHIARLIDALAREHGLELVTVEGASRTVDVSQLAGFADTWARDEAGQYLLREGRITGPEYYAATGRRPVRLVGIEEPRLYRRSVEVVQEFLNEESQGFLFDLREGLNELKPDVYSPELLALDKERMSYHEGDLSLLKYAVRLSGAARAARISLEAYPQLTRYVQARREGFGEDVDPDQLLQELDGLDRALRSRLYRESAQKELDSLLQRLEVMERLLNISVTQEELAAVRRNPAHYRVKPFLQFFNRIGGPGQIPEFGIEALDAYLAQSMDFYRLADERSQVFVDHTLTRMDESQQDMAMLVTGGFHAPQILAELKRRGVTYVAVRPRLTRQDVVNPYFSLLRNRKTPLDKLLAQNQNILQIATAFPQVGQPAFESTGHPESIRLLSQMLDMLKALGRALRQIRSHQLGEIDLVNPETQTYAERLAHGVAAVIRQPGRSWRRWVTSMSVGSLTFGRFPVVLTSEVSLAQHQAQLLNEKEPTQIWTVWTWIVDPWVRLARLVAAPDLYRRAIARLVDPTARLLSVVHHELARLPQILRDLTPAQQTILSSLLLVGVWLGLAQAGLVQALAQGLGHTGWLPATGGTLLSMAAVIPFPTQAHLVGLGTNPGLKELRAWMIEQAKEQNMIVGHADVVKNSHDETSLNKQGQLRVTIGNLGLQDPFLDALQQVLDTYLLLRSHPTMPAEDLWKSWAEQFRANPNLEKNWTAYFKTIQSTSQSTPILQQANQYLINAKGTVFDPRPELGPFSITHAQMEEIFKGFAESFIQTALQRDTVEAKQGYAKRIVDTFRNGETREIRARLDLWITRLKNLAMVDNMLVLLAQGREQHLPVVFLVNPDQVETINNFLMIHQIENIAVHRIENPKEANPFQANLKRSLKKYPGRNFLSSWAVLFVMGLGWVDQAQAGVLDTALAGNRMGGWLLGLGALGLVLSAVFIRQWLAKHQGQIAARVASAVRRAIQRLQQQLATMTPRQQTALAAVLLATAAWSILAQAGLIEMAALLLQSPDFALGSGGLVLSMGIIIQFPKNKVEPSVQKPTSEKPKRKSVVSFFSPPSVHLVGISGQEAQVGFETRLVRHAVDGKVILGHEIFTPGVARLLADQYKVGHHLIRGLNTDLVQGLDWVLSQLAAIRSAGKMNDQTLHQLITQYIQSPVFRVIFDAALPVTQTNEQEKTVLNCLRQNTENDWTPEKTVLALKSSGVSLEQWQAILQRLARQWFQAVSERYSEKIQMTPEGFQHFLNTSDPGSDQFFTIHWVEMIQTLEMIASAAELIPEVTKIHRPLVLVVKTKRLQEMATQLQTMNLGHIHVHPDITSEQIVKLENELEAETRRLSKKWPQPGTILLALLAAWLGWAELAQAGLMDALSAGWPVWDGSLWPEGILLSGMLIPFRTKTEPAKPTASAKTSTRPKVIPIKNPSVVHLVSVSDDYLLDAIATSLLPEIIAKKLFFGSDALAQTYLKWEQLHSAQEKGHKPYELGDPFLETLHWVLETLDFIKRLPRMDPVAMDQMVRRYIESADFRRTWHVFAPATAAKNPINAILEASQNRFSAYPATLKKLNQLDLKISSWQQLFSGWAAALFASAQDRYPGPDDRSRTMDLADLDWLAAQRTEAVLKKIIDLSGRAMEEKKPAVWLVQDSRFRQLAAALRASGQSQIKLHEDMNPFDIAEFSSDVRDQINRLAWQNRIPILVITALAFGLGWAGWFQPGWHMPFIAGLSQFDWSQWASGVMLGAVIMMKDRRGGPGSQPTTAGTTSPKSAIIAFERQPSAHLIGVDHLPAELQALWSRVADGDLLLGIEDVRLRPTHLLAPESGSRAQVRVLRDPLLDHLYQALSHYKAIGLAQPGEDRTKAIEQMIQWLIRVYPYSAEFRDYAQAYIENPMASGDGRKFFASLAAAQISASPLTLNLNHFSLDLLAKIMHGFCEGLVYTLQEKYLAPDEPTIMLKEIFDHGVERWVNMWRVKIVVANMVKLLHEARKQNKPALVMVGSSDVVQIAAAVRGMGEKAIKINEDFVNHEAPALARDLAAEAGRLAFSRQSLREAQAEKDQASAAAQPGVDLVGLELAQNITEKLKFRAAMLRLAAQGQAVVGVEHIVQGTEKQAAQDMDLGQPGQMRGLENELYYMLYWALSLYRDIMRNREIDNDALQDLIRWHRNSALFKGFWQHVGSHKDFIAVHAVIDSLLTQNDRLPIKPLANKMVKAIPQPRVWASLFKRLAYVFFQQTIDHPQYKEICDRQPDVFLLYDKDVNGFLADPTNTQAGQAVMENWLNTLRTYTMAENVARIIKEAGDLQLPAVIVVDSGRVPTLQSFLRQMKQPVKNVYENIDNKQIKEIEVSLKQERTRMGKTGIIRIILALGGFWLLGLGVAQAEMLDKEMISYQGEAFWLGLGTMVAVMATLWAINKLTLRKQVENFWLRWVQVPASVVISLLALDWIGRDVSLLVRTVVLRDSLEGLLLGLAAGVVLGLAAVYVQPLKTLLVQAGQRLNQAWERNFGSLLIGQISWKHLAKAWREQAQANRALDGQKPVFGFATGFANNKLLKLIRQRKMMKINNSVAEAQTFGSYIARYNQPMAILNITDLFYLHRIFELNPTFVVFNSVRLQQTIQGFKTKYPDVLMLLQQPGSGSIKPEILAAADGVMISLSAVNDLGNGLETRIQAWRQANPDIVIAIEALPGDIAAWERFTRLGADYILSTQTPTHRQIRRLAAYKLDWLREIAQQDNVQESSGRGFKWMAAVSGVVATLVYGFGQWNWITVPVLGVAAVLGLYALAKVIAVTRAQAQGDKPEALIEPLQKYARLNPGVADQHKRVLDRVTRRSGVVIAGFVGQLPRYWQYTIAAHVALHQKGWPEGLAYLLEGVAGWAWMLRDARPTATRAGPKARPNTRNIPNSYRSYPAVNEISPKMTEHELNAAFWQDLRDARGFWNQQSQEVVRQAIHEQLPPGAAQKDYYSILKVNKQSTPKDIAKAYRAAQTQYRANQGPGLVAPEAEQAWQAAREAREVLRDANVRALYDRARQLQHAARQRIFADLKQYTIFIPWVLAGLGLAWAVWQQAPGAESGGVVLGMALVYRDLLADLNPGVHVVGLSQAARRKKVAARMLERASQGTLVYADERIPKGAEAEVAPRRKLDLEMIRGLDSDLVTTLHWALYTYFEMNRRAALPFDTFPKLLAHYKRSPGFRLNWDRVIGNQLKPEYEKSISAVLQADYPTEEAVRYLKALKINFAEWNNLFNKFVRGLITEANQELPLQEGSNRQVTSAIFDQGPAEIEDTIQAWLENVRTQTLIRNITALVSKARNLKRPVVVFVDPRREAEIVAGLQSNQISNIQVYPSTDSQQVRKLEAALDKEIRRWSRQWKNLVPYLGVALLFVLAWAVWQQAPGSEWLAAMAVVGKVDVKKAKNLDYQAKQLAKAMREQGLTAVPVDGAEDFHVPLIEAQALIKSGDAILKTEPLLSLQPKKMTIEEFQLKINQARLERALALEQALDRENQFRVPVRGMNPDQDPGLNSVEALRVVLSGQALFDFTGTRVELIMDLRENGQQVQANRRAQAMAVLEFFENNAGQLAFRVNESEEQTIGPIKKFDLPNLEEAVDLIADGWLGVSLDRQTGLAELTSEGESLQSILERIRRNRQERAQGLDQTLPLGQTEVVLGDSQVRLARQDALDATGLGLLNWALEDGHIVVWPVMDEPETILQSLQEARESQLLAVMPKPQTPFVIMGWDQETELTLMDLLTAVRAGYLKVAKVQETVVYLQVTGITNQALAEFIDEDRIKNTVEFLNTVGPKQSFIALRGQPNANLTPSRNEAGEDIYDRVLGWSEENGKIEVFPLAMTDEEYQAHLAKRREAKAREWEQYLSRQRQLKQAEFRQTVFKGENRDDARLNSLLAKYTGVSLVREVAKYLRQGWLFSFKVEEMRDRSKALAFLVAGEQTDFMEHLGQDRDAAIAKFQQYCINQKVYRIGFRPQAGKASGAKKAGKKTAQSALSQEFTFNLAEAITMIQKGMTAFEEPRSGQPAHLVIIGIFDEHRRRVTEQDVIQLVQKARQTNAQAYLQHQNKTTMPAPIKALIQMGRLTSHQIAAEIRSGVFGFSTELNKSLWVSGMAFDELIQKYSSKAMPGKNIRWQDLRWILAGAPLAAIAAALAMLWVAPEQQFLAAGIGVYAVAVFGMALGKDMGWRQAQSTGMNVYNAIWVRKAALAASRNLTLDEELASSNPFVRSHGLLHQWLDGKPVLALLNRYEILVHVLDLFFLPLALAQVVRGLLPHEFSWLTSHPSLFTARVSLNFMALSLSPIVSLLPAIVDVASVWLAWQPIQSTHGLAAMILPAGFEDKGKRVQQAKKFGVAMRAAGETQVVAEGLGSFPVYLGEAQELIRSGQAFFVSEPLHLKSAKEMTPDEFRKAILDARQERADHLRRFMEKQKLYHVTVQGLNKEKDPGLNRVEALDLVLSGQALFNAKGKQADLIMAIPEDWDWVQEARNKQAEAMLEWFDTPGRMWELDVSPAEASLAEQVLPYELPNPEEAMAFIDTGELAARIDPETGKIRFIPAGSSLQAILDTTREIRLENATDLDRRLPVDQTKITLDQSEVSISRQDALDAVEFGLLEWEMRNRVLAIWPTLHQPDEVLAALRAARLKALAAMDSNQITRFKIKDWKQPIYPSSDELEAGVAEGILKPQPIDQDGVVFFVVRVITHEDLATRFQTQRNQSADQFINTVPKTQTFIALSGQEKAEIRPSRLEAQQHIREGRLGWKQTADGRIVVEPLFISTEAYQKILVSERQVKANAFRDFLKTMLKKKAIFDDVDLSAETTDEPRVVDLMKKYIGPNLIREVPRYLEKGWIYSRQIVTAADGQKVLTFELAGDMAEFFEDLGAARESSAAKFKSHCDTNQIYWLGLKTDAPRGKSKPKVKKPLPQSSFGFNREEGHWLVLQGIAGWEITRQGVQLLVLSNSQTSPVQMPNDEFVSAIQELRQADADSFITLWHKNQNAVQMPREIRQLLDDGVITENIIFQQLVAGRLTFSVLAQREEGTLKISGMDPDQWQRQYQPSEKKNGLPRLKNIRWQDLRRVMVVAPVVLIAALLLAAWVPEVRSAALGVGGSSAVVLANGLGKAWGLRQAQTPALRARMKWTGHAWQESQPLDQAAELQSSNLSVRSHGLLHQWLDGIPGLRALNQARFEWAVHVLDPLLLPVAAAVMIQEKMRSHVAAIPAQAGPTPEQLAAHADRLAPEVLHEVVYDGFASGEIGWLSLYNRWTNDTSIEQDKKMRAAATYVLRKSKGKYYVLLGRRGDRARDDNGVYSIISGGVDFARAEAFESDREVAQLQKNNLLASWDTKEGIETSVGAAMRETAEETENDIVARVSEVAGRIDDYTDKEGRILVHGSILIQEINLLTVKESSEFGEHVWVPLSLILSQPEEQAGAEVEKHIRQVTKNKNAKLMAGLKAEGLKSLRRVMLAALRRDLKSAGPSDNQGLIEMLRLFLRLGPDQSPRAPRQTLRAETQAPARPVTEPGRAAQALRDRAALTQAASQVPRLQRLPRWLLRIPGLRPGWMILRTIPLLLGSVGRLRTAEALAQVLVSHELRAILHVAVPEMPVDLKELLKHPEQVRIGVLTRDGRSFWQWFKGQWFADYRNTGTGREFLAPAYLLTVLAENDPATMGRITWQYRLASQVLANMVKWQALAAARADLLDQGVSLAGVEQELAARAAEPVIAPAAWSAVIGQTEFFRAQQGQLNLLPTELIALCHSALSLATAVTGQSFSQAGPALDQARADYFSRQPRLETLANVLQDLPATKDPALLALKKLAQEARSPETKEDWAVVLSSGVLAAAKRLIDGRSVEQAAREAQMAIQPNLSITRVDILDLPLDEAAGMLAQVRAALTALQPHAAKASGAQQQLETVEQALSATLGEPSQVMLRPDSPSWESRLVGMLAQQTETSLDLGEDFNQYKRAGQAGVAIARVQRNGGEIRLPRPVMLEVAMPLPTQTAWSDLVQTIRAGTAQDMSARFFQGRFRASGRLVDRLPSAWAQALDRLGARLPEAAGVLKTRLRERALQANPVQAWQAMLDQLPADGPLLLASHVRAVRLDSADPLAEAYREIILRPTPEAKAELAKVLLRMMRAQAPEEWVVFSKIFESLGAIPSVAVAEPDTQALAKQLAEAFPNQTVQIRIPIALIESRRGRGALGFATDQLEKGGFAVDQEILRLFLRLGLQSFAGSA